MLLTSHLIFLFRINSLFLPHFDVSDFSYGEVMSDFHHLNSLGHLKLFNLISNELKKRDMLTPAEIILDSILEDRADIPINAIHVHSGLKADLYPVREGDELRQRAFRRREQVDYGPPIGKLYIHSPEDLILYKLMYFGLSQQSKHSRDIAAILKSKKNELDLNYIERWAARLGLISLWKEMLDNVS